MGVYLDTDKVYKLIYAKYTTIKAFVEVCGISQGTICRAKRTGKASHFYTAQSIADKLGVKVQDIIIRSR